MSSLSEVFDASFCLMTADVLDYAVLASVQPIGHAKLNGLNLHRLIMTASNLGIERINRFRPRRRR